MGLGGVVCDGAWAPTSLADTALVTVDILCRVCLRIPNLDGTATRPRIVQSYMIRSPGYPTRGIPDLAIRLQNPFHTPRRPIHGPRRPIHGPTCPVHTLPRPVHILPDTIHTLFCGLHTHPCPFHTPPCPLHTRRIHFTPRRGSGNTIFVKFSTFHRFPPPRQNQVPIPTPHRTNSTTHHAPRITPHAPTPYASRPTH